MKTKLDQNEKARRQEWRNVAYQGPKSVVAERIIQVPKPDRAAPAKPTKQAKAAVLVEPRTVLADVFQGTTYAGAYVHVTHKQAFEKRVTKRLAKLAAEVHAAQDAPKV